MLPFEQLRQVAEEARGAVVTGADHWVAEQRSEELLGLLRPFLA